MNRESPRRETQHPRLMYDIVIDIYAEGQLVHTASVPTPVTEAINAAIDRSHDTGLIEHQGVRYRWSIRPCVFP